MLIPASPYFARLQEFGKEEEETSGRDAV